MPGRGSFDRMAHVIEVLMQEPMTDSELQAETGYDIDSIRNMRRALAKRKHIEPEGSRYRAGVSGSRPLVWRWVK